MARASDWSPLGMDSDPTPGDPADVRTLADELQTFADDVGEALGKIRGMAGDRAVQDWSGLSAEAFRDEFDGVPDNLTKLQNSYDLCAQALHTYWPKLETAQGQADRALERAVAAQADLTAAQADLNAAWEQVWQTRDEVNRLERAGERTDAEPPDDSEVRAATRERTAAETARHAARDRVDDAQERLTAARRLAEQAKEMREEAARNAARDIDEASDAGIHNRKWWEDAFHWVSENWDTIVDVCKVVVAVLGIVVMIIGGPLAWVVLAAALVVLADTLIKYSQGRAGLLDVGLALLDCIPGMKGITTLGGLARGLKGGLAAARTGMRGLSAGVRGLGPAIRRAGRDIRGLTCRTDPIDMATGEVVLSATDVDLPGVLPLVLRRHHRSSVRSGTWFGRSWASTLDQRLVLDAEGVRLCAEDGMTLYYPRPLPDAPVMPVEGPRHALAWEDGPGSPLTVTDRATGHTLHFAPIPGRLGGELPLTALTDRNGNRISVTYDEQGAPTGLVHDAGYHVGITTHDGRVTELRLLSAPDRPLLRRYAYDERGNLAAVHDPEHDRPLRLTYDGRRRLTGWTDRNGMVYRYTYDEAGRCVATDGTGGFLASTVEYDEAHHRTLFTDSLGHTTVYQFNDCYQLVAETDPLGGTMHRTTDRYDRLLSITDPLGHTTAYSYDDNGDMTGMVRPDGAVLSAEYNAAGQQTLAVEADGTTWRQEYDDHGNPTALTDPAGHVTRWSWAPGGRLASVTDPLGGTTRTETDAAGLTMAVTDPSGGTVRYERDAFGRPVSITDPLGAVHQMGWTTDGSPLWHTDPHGNRETWTWDAEGNCLSHTDPSGATTRYTYGPFDVTVTETKPGGAVHRFTHDTELRVIGVTGPDGRTWTYRHDAAGRLVSENDFDGRTVTYRHDAAGRLTARVNALGQTVTHQHDALGRVTAKDVDGVRTDFAFDAAGRIVRATGPGSEVRQERDALGRVTAETNAGSKVTQTYDPLGRVLARTTPSGHRTAWAYDTAGAPTAMTSGTRTLRLTHDAAGRETLRTLDTGATIAHEWDALARRTGQTVTAADRTTHRRTWSYGAGRGPVTVGDDILGTAVLTADAEGRVTAVDAPDRHERYAYDAAGNQTHADWSTAHHDDTAAGPRVLDGTRLVRAGGFHCTHDAEGRIVERRREGSPTAWRYTWDAEDRLTSTTTPDGTVWQYRYDPFGRRTAKERLAPDGTVAERTAFTWSGSVLVEETTTGPGLPGRTVSWDFDGLIPVAQTDRANDDAVRERFHALLTDLVGSPTALITDDGALAWQSDATHWGLTTTGSGATASTPLRFPGQYADAETGWHYNLHRHYDPATGRYASADPLGLSPAPNPVAYVPRPQELADPLGLTPCSPTPYRARMPWGRPDRQLVFDGHGGFPRWSLFRRTTVVPEGTAIAFYSRHGEALSYQDGISVNLGGPVAIFDRGQMVGSVNAVPVEIAGPGTRIPNYRLYPLDADMQAYGDPFTVDSPVRLSELLQPNLGLVHWSACRSIV
ncbi:DUF6531 domain-containing protein [Streptomyces sp. RFCAC02]|uniref:DUF6531 domain-containing protein n=1 Tax=Streptomyces sp. RFCAC02 TaxID=2499143 RepID=UPI00102140EC|nr:DUF6531 domain-containing protein [Streptomyces sp. RFCAC02]